MRNNATWRGALRELGAEWLEALGFIVRAAGVLYFCHLFFGWRFPF